MLHLWAGLAGAAAGAAAGAVGPALIRRLPPPEVEPDEPPVDYLGIAAAARLRPGLAVVGAVLLGALTLVLPVWAWAGAAAVGLVAAGLGYIDIREHVLPDAVLAPTAAVAAVALTVTAALTGRWLQLGVAAAIGAIWLVLFLLLALVAGGGFGLGDVKLAGLLGLVTGWLGVGTAVTGLVIAVATGGLVTVALLVTKRVDRKAAIPFGPFLLFGWWLASLLTPLTVGPLPAA